MGEHPSQWPHGLMFHRFHREGSRPLGRGSITDAELDAILRHIGPERILNPREWLSRVKAGTLQCADICITFDDGLRSQIEVALPILDRLGLKAFWFVFSSVLKGVGDRNEISSFLATSVFSTFEEFAGRFEEHAQLNGDKFFSDEFTEFANNLRANFSFYSDAEIRFRYSRNCLLAKDEFDAIVDRMVVEAGFSVPELASRLWLTSEDLRPLHQAGHAIGLHSWCHPFILANLPISEQETEYKENHQHLSDVMGDPPESMSHPLNSYSKETLRILKDLNISCGFRSNMRVPEGSECVNPSSLEFGRVDSAELLEMI